MQYRKFPVLLSFALFFSGCSGKTPPQTPRQNNRPTGFWENKESVFQVLHFYNKLDIDSDNKPVLDANGKITTSLMMSIGTGFVVDANGLVMTNNHVITEECNIQVSDNKVTLPIPTDCTAKLEVTLDRLAAPLLPELFQVCTVTLGLRDCKLAEVVAKDEKHDLALLHTDEHFSRIVKFADDRQLTPGDEVYFWGNVSAFLPPSPFFGRYVGHIGPPYYTGENFGKQLPLVLLDLNLSSGSSGSPMFNSEGKCVSVGDGYTNTGFTGGRPLGISIPSSTAIKFLKENPWPRPKKK